MPDRFNLDITRKDFYCYDCSKTVSTGGQFSWDNNRKTRICLLCLDKLKEIVGSSDDSVSDAPTKKKVYWDKSMLPTKPWTIGNHDINSWPIHIQKEYSRLSSSPSAYEQGLKAARNRLGYGSDHCPECEEEDKSKREWRPEYGTIEDWVEQIRAQKDKEQCIALWEHINEIKWTSEEATAMGKEYVKRLANLVSLELYGKHFTGALPLALR
jgi:hypothetical protein